MAKTDDTGAGDQRRDVDPERGQHDEGDDHEKNGENELPQQYEQCRTAGADASSLLSVIARQWHLLFELLVDAGLDQLPDNEPEIRTRKTLTTSRAIQSSQCDVEAPQPQRGKKKNTTSTTRKAFLINGI